MKKYSSIVRWVFLLIYLFILLRYTGIIGDNSFIFSKQLLDSHRLDFNKYWPYFATLSATIFLLEYIFLFKRSATITYHKALRFTIIFLMLTAFFAQILISTIFSILFWMLYLYNIEFSSTENTSNKTK